MPGPVRRVGRTSHTWPPSCEPLMLLATGLTKEHI